MTRRRDDQTLDLFNWTPPEVVERFEDRKVRAASWRSRVAMAVAETLKTCGIPRETIAADMSEWLGEDVSVAMLDNYASPAKEDHTIPMLRAIALCTVTGDPRLLQLACEPLNRSVVENRYLGAIQEAMATEQIEQLDKLRRQGRRQWRGRR